MADINHLTESIIGCAIEVHRHLGPGLLEGTYEEALCIELDDAAWKLQRQLMLDEREFLSPYGIRSVSRHHLEHPYKLGVNGDEHRVDYEPAESTTGLFGGNSNWRGPIWFPVNYLLIESLQKFHYYFGDDFKVECPTGSGQMMTLWDVATDISRRLARIFQRDADGRRPVHDRHNG